MMKQDKVASVKDLLISGILCSTIFPAAGAIPAGLDKELTWAEKHRGKAGFYLRLAENERAKRPDFYFSHPLVDAVVVNIRWKDMEPEPGQYDFSEIDAMLDLCRKYGKGLLLCISTYGQTPGNQPTPEWLYDKGIKRIRFSGGGVAAGREICVPRVWDQAYYPEYGRLIRALGEQYNGRPEIWYVMPGFGHIGNITAQPSKDGGPAFLAEGWTPEIWAHHCLAVTELFQKAFPDTPLMVKSESKYIRELSMDHYIDDLNALLLELAKQHVSIIGCGLEPDLELILKTQSVSSVSRLAEYTVNGGIRLGMGDDWPLWIPEERRKRSGPFISGRDDDGLARELQYAFGDGEGLEKTRISVMYVLHPEIGASHPDNEDGQNEVVYELLKKARDRLKREDPVAHFIRRGGRENTN